MLLALMFSSVTVAAAAGASAPAAAEIVAGPGGGSIRLDGRLDETEWKAAGAIPGLTQQSPVPGGSTPYGTEIRVLSDGENLYLGITCFDPEPGKIAVHTMQRDGEFSGDDTVAFVFDTFGDRRNGYYFRLNAAGARQDGLISGPEEISLDWDGIWDARVQRSGTGWTAEIVVPARTLRFKPALAEWGFNVERTVSRDRLTLRWAGTTLDSSLYDLRRTGTLRGVSDLKQGLGLSVSPYGLARASRGADGMDSSAEGDGGVDLVYNVTPGVTAVATANTDFAETEVDTRQINLTRFPLFFPEKRPFFLEGSNLYEFGLGLGTEFIPFFSRRIGLVGGSQVPIDGGAKVLGRAGRWGIALMDVATRDTTQAPAENLFAGRVTFDADEHLRLGVIGTNGDPEGTGDNALGGLDAVWRTSRLLGDKNFSLGGWTARSAGDLPDGRRDGWGFKVDYPNDLWDLYVAVNQYGDALDPALGFLPRPGTRSYAAGAAFQPRPQGGRFGWARQFFLEMFPTRVDDLYGDPESWRVFTAPFNVETRTGEHLEANWAPQFERLDLPFEVSPGVVIQPGEYRFTRYRAEAQSSQHRPWRVGSTVWFGEFFTGRLTQWESFVWYDAPAGHLQIELGAENDFGNLPEGDFVQRLLQIRTVYAFTPSLILSAFTQYDSESRLLGLNARLRWTLRPGNDLFAVWNRDWERTPDPTSRYAFGPRDSQVVVKLRWTFRW